MLYYSNLLITIRFDIGSLCAGIDVATELNLNYGTNSQSTFNADW